MSLCISFTSDPSLFQWLTKLKDSVLSKCTIVFYDKLEEQCLSSPGKHMKSYADENISKLSYGINFLQKIETFQRQVISKGNGAIMSTLFSLLHGMILNLGHKV